MKNIPAFLKYGLHASVASILLTVILQFTPLQNKGALWVNPDLIIFVGAVVLAILEKKRQLGGFITFSQGFKSGFFTMLVAAFLISAFSYINNKFLDRAAFEEQIAMAEDEIERQKERMEDSGQDPEAVEGMMRIFLTPGFMALTQFIGICILGLVIALIVAAILRRDPPANINNDSLDSDYSPYHNQPDNKNE